MLEICCVTCVSSVYAVDTRHVFVSAPQCRTTSYTETQGLSGKGLWLCAKLTLTQHRPAQDITLHHPPQDITLHRLPQDITLYRPSQDITLHRPAPPTTGHNLAPPATGHNHAPPTTDNKNHAWTSRYSISKMMVTRAQCA